MIGPARRGRAQLRLLNSEVNEADPGRPAVTGLPARVPPGVCVYAIGDIHGRAELLNFLHHQIALDASQLTPGTHKIVLYIGDYVDRGPESRQVLDLLIHEPLEDFHPVYLLGDHDAWLLNFLIDAAKIAPSWLRHGGDATRDSYGVRLRQRVDDLPYYQDLQSDLRERIPRRHVEFLERLDLRYEVGDYLFVHAGVRPSVSLDRQTAADLILIGETFLGSRRDFGKIVVHGHSVEAEPAVRANRIGIDTGACWTGSLTCLVLEEDRHRFLGAATAV
ncbi:MAG: serine/threonine protein phosphatase [Geminicoccaceae bacterium]|nr:serine/threonine protein phosphatase [Geminicoccaceae bacterium]